VKTRGRRSPAPFELALREGDELFELNRFGHFLLVSETGVHLGRSRRANESTFISHESITHVAHHRRTLSLATRQGLHVVVRGRRRPVAFGEVHDAIERRIARLPGGLQQLSRFRELDQRQQQAGLPWVTSTVVGICLVLHLLQVSDPFVSEVGAFVRELVGQGEYWRLVTAHFLHDATWSFSATEMDAAVPLLFRLPFHIVLNCLLASLLGWLVEPALGRLRTVWVLGMAAFGANLLCALFQTPPMLGASGLVLGLAGALLALEVSVPERLPATWRVPRRTLLLALALQAVGDWFLPFIAWAAHLGGFLGGYTAGRLVAKPAARRDRAPSWLRGAVAALAGVFVLGVAGMAPLVMRMGWAFNDHARHVLALPDPTSFTLNNLAWRMATETDVLGVAPAPALALAQRAVGESGRSNPDYLDTLAEIQFGAGDAASAVETIEEAIELAPGDAYFAAQRDRFTGRRAAGDRPASPPLPWFLRGPAGPPRWVEDDGLDI